MDENSILSSQRNELETTTETDFRPKNFSQFIGQKNVQENIRIMIESSNLRSQAMDHVLLSGPPGLGKTSLAMIVASSLGSQLHMVSGPAVEKKGDLAAVLTNLNPRDVLFIDEIHRINIAIEEILYSAMEDFRLDILIGEGASARTMQINIPPFTLIGATTRAGLLSAPLRDRFNAHLHFDFYQADDLVSIISNNAEKIGLNISKQALDEIAIRARGTPRIANRILRRVRDYSIVSRVEKTSTKEVNASLALMEIDSFGLDSMDRKILKVIKDYYNGGPVGIEAICATLGEDRTTIEDVHEPYLLKRGFVMRTARGRIISEAAKNHHL